MSIIHFSIIIIILMIIFYIYLIMRNRKQIEGFYTFYLPFYHGELNDNIIKLKQHNKPYFDNIFNYNTLKIGYEVNNITLYNEKPDKYTELLSKLIMEKTNRIKIELIKYNTSLDLINALNENKVGMINSSSIAINNYYQKKVGDTISNNMNILYICNSYKLYLFMIIRKDKGIERLSSIKNKMKVGITNTKSSSYQTFSRLAQFTKLKEGVDFIYVFKSNNEDVLNALNNNEIDLAVFKTTFPSYSLSMFFTNNHMKNYILLPIDDISNKIYQENSFLNKSIIDLNDILTFLPKSINGIYYHRFKPDFNILSIQYYLLTNKQHDNKIISQTMNILKNNYVLFNKLPEFKYNKLSRFSVGFGDEKKPLCQSNSSKKFLYEKGFYTNTNNENCKYFVGYNNCNKESLKNYGFI